MCQRSKNCCSGEHEICECSAAPCSTAPRFGELFSELAVLDLGCGGTPVFIGDRVAHRAAHLIPARFRRSIGAPLGGEVQTVFEERASVLEAVLDLGSVTAPVFRARAAAAHSGVPAVRRGGRFDCGAVLFEEHDHLLPVVSVATRAVSPEAACTTRHGDATLFCRESTVAVALILGEEVRVHTGSVRTGIVLCTETSSASVHLLSACGSAITARAARRLESGKAMKKD